MSGNGCVSSRSQKVDFHSGLILKIAASVCGIILTAFVGIGVNLLQDGIENQRQIAVMLGEMRGEMHALNAHVTANRREIIQLNEDVDWIRDRLMEDRRATEPQ